MFKVDYLHVFYRKIILLSQEIVRILCILLVNCRVRNIMLLVHILSLMKPVYTLPPVFNIILSPLLKFLQGKDFKAGTFYYFIAFLF